MSTTMNTMEEQPKSPVSEETSSSKHSDPHTSVQELKAKLNAINDEKEKWFAKRLEIGNQIKAEIQKIKDSLGKRNALSATVQHEKKKRDELNKIISEKVKEAKSLQGDKKEEVKVERKMHPEELRKQIAGLEKRIETEGLSFDKEKQLMKTINTLRKQYATAMKAEEGWAKSRGVSKEISDLKKQANEAHKVVQESAKESQTKHESLITESRKIDELKKVEKEAHDKFMELKKQFNDTSIQLKMLLPELREMRETRKKQRFEQERSAEEQNKKTLAEKIRTVEEKLKSGGKKVKLTMEDLLAFQGMKE